jgi:hypothetical protein
MRRHINAVEQRARFGGIKHRRFPEVTTCWGPRTVSAGLIGTTWPFTSQSNIWRSAASRCLTECSQFARRRLDPSGEVYRLDASDRRHAGVGAPCVEFLRSSSIGSPRVWVADVRRKEFEKGHRGALTGRRDKRRNDAPG